MVSAEAQGGNKAGFSNSVQRLLTKSKSKTFRSVVFVSMSFDDTDTSALDQILGLDNSSTSLVSSLATKLPQK
jgi:hypothetical protein